jgi:hypothetical protein
VSVSAAVSGTYDVKIFIENELNKTISEILDSGKWRSPQKYILAAYPDTDIFSIRAISYSDSASLCVRLRKTNATSFTDKCQPIKLNQDSSASSSSVPDDKPASSVVDTKPVKQNVQSVQTDNAPIPQVVKDDKIYLNSAPPAQTAELTGYARTRLVMIGGFSLLALVLLVLMALDRI